MAKKLVLVLLLVVAIGIAAILFFFKYICYPRDKDGMVYRFRVNCDEDKFQSTRTDYMFVPGNDVLLIFRAAEDEDYSFHVDGVENFDAKYYLQVGYLIRFEMPGNVVDVSYEMKENRNISDAAEEINIALRENPTTGFEWSYEVIPEGIIEIQDDFYISDPSDPKEPIVGQGGTHFWSFKIVGEGMTELRFVEKRGDEQIEPEWIYKYECNGTTAKKRN